jgi:ketosteroid isomerase-like protein
MPATLGLVMDSHDELAVNPAAPPLPNLAAIEKVFELLEASGPLAAAEELMGISHENVELHSYLARGAARPGDAKDEVIRGREEVVAFLRRTTDEGVSIRARAQSFEVEGDSVVVRGSARVGRPDGSFAETKLSWTYRFRDGLIDEISWQPRAGD